MPSIIGNVKITNVSASSNAQFGDVGFIYLNSITKMYAGANSFNIGDSFGPNISNNQGSSTNTNDPADIEANV